MKNKKKTIYFVVLLAILIIGISLLQFRHVNNMQKCDQDCKYSDHY